MLQDRKSFLDGTQLGDPVEQLRLQESIAEVFEDTEWSDSGPPQVCGLCKNISSMKRLSPPREGSVIGIFFGVYGLCTRNLSNEEIMTQPSYRQYGPFDEVRCFNPCEAAKHIY